MADKPEDDTFSIQIANQMINIVNTRMQEGAPVDELAQGLRHAAANFSAFAETQRPGGVDHGRAVEEFIRLLEYYLSRHAPPEHEHGPDCEHGEPEEGPAAGLKNLIKQVKNEI